ncbi:hypothetical protein SALBM311S_11232 [Streptomyces alboniger]
MGGRARGRGADHDLLVAVGEVEDVAGTVTGPTSGCRKVLHRAE